MTNDKQRSREPEVGTTVHFWLVGGGYHFDCVPAIIVKVEDGSELGPNEVPHEHMVHLAIVTPQGRSVLSGIPYEPLSARDFTGSWHYKNEHGKED